MPELGDIMIGGFAIAPLVVALVALAKTLGLPAKYAPHFNGGLSMVLWLAAVYILPMYPQAEPFVVAVIGAVVVFLSASGIYQFGKTARNK